MSQFSAGQSVATARILLLVVKAVLDSVMKESEEAVMKVTVALNNMSELSESQRKRLALFLLVYAISWHQSFRCITS
jgi:hypothetical protein